MPIRSRIDASRRLVTTVAEGIVTDDDIRAFRRDVAADPEFEPSFDQLVDMTGVERVDVSFDLRVDVVETSLFTEGSRRAIVAPEPHQMGFARQYALMSSGGGRRDTVMVFASREEAEAWLEID